MFFFIINNFFFTKSFQIEGILTYDLNHLKFFFFDFNLLILILIYLLIYTFKKESNVVFMSIIFFFFNLMYLFFFKNFDEKLFILNKTYLIDNFSNSFKVLIIIYFIIFSLFFFSQNKTSFNIKKEKELYIYFLQIMFYCFFLLESFDFISFFITVEAATFILIAMLFLNNHSEVSKEAGFKYFFLHALSSSCLILTILIFIYIFKTTNYLTLLYYFLFSNIFFKLYFNYSFIKWLIYISIISLFFFIFFKFSIFPCHF